ncbi:activating signal cointegrator 1 complex subunit 2-like isoform X2 [Ornithodoros turicata]|uniref:activating signal cointegrator 1 complex subunit 2-like isoform X2 n=1 Tax=Ornithodoros turicata TaxID=34597 RepID=UPI003139B0D8
MTETRKSNFLRFFCGNVARSVVTLSCSRHGMSAWERMDANTAVPLHDREITVTDKHGQMIKVPAVSRGFVEVVSWLKYRPARSIFSFEDAMAVCAGKTESLCDKYSASISEWMSRMVYIEEDLTKALRIPYNRFWSHAIFDDGFHQVLESYLRLAPRYAELSRYLITEQMERLENNVNRLVFRTFLRLATHKESKLNFIDKRKFGDMIYDNFVFDIPKVMDICTLYQRGNSSLVCRMVENIISSQPNYTADIAGLEDTLILALQRARESLHSPDEEAAELGMAPRRLDEGIQGSELSRMPLSTLVDRVSYAVDIACSSLAFIEVYPTAAKIWSLEKVGPQLAEFFDSTFPVLKEELVKRNRKQSFEPVFTMLKKRLSYAKTCVLKIFRAMLQQSCLQPLIELGQCGERGKEIPYLESFFEVICNCLTEKHFIFAYQQRYPVEEDIHMFDEYKFAVDHTSTLYVLQSICMIYEGLGCKPPTNLCAAQDMATVPKMNSVMSFDTKEVTRDKEEKASKGPSDSKLESEIANLKEFFPDLSTGFIESCLQYYNNNHEEVVMAILDDNLPPDLSKQRPSNSVEKPLVFEPRSIYDNDEMDILRRDDVDLSRFHMGKKNKTPKSLDDPAHEKVLKEVYERYNIVQDEAVAEDTYEDEYDDTYDTNDVGLEEPSLEDELTLRRPFTVPRVLDTRPGRRNGDNRQAEYEEYTDAPEQAPPRDQFVANPAEVRARQEQRYQARLEQRGGARRRDVQGGPRGQGQTRDVVRDRQYKERHKGSFTHNQRSQADFKRSRGMYS